MEGTFVEFRHVRAVYPGQAGIGALLGKTKPPVIALQDISFSLKKGEHVTIFGRGGSGKTTLLTLLSGMLLPESGMVLVDGNAPQSIPTSTHGYVSVDHDEAKGSTVYEMLHTFGTTHKIPSLPSRIGEIAELLSITPLLHRNAFRLSLAERLRVKIARAALSKAPVVLLDDVADVLGAAEMNEILQALFVGRTVCMTTRSVHIAEALGAPILLLHKASLAHMGNTGDIAYEAGVERVVHAWVEGMRYDMLRKLRSHPGVLEVRLMPTDRFEGTCVRITLRNSRYLPALYDALSAAPLISIEELPVGLSEILDSLS